MFLNSVADKLVFKFLNRIHSGYLELTTFEGKNLNFGDPNQKLKANILIKKPNFNYNLIRGGSIGFAESYMRGEFETDNLSNLIELTARNIEIIYKFSGLLDFPMINFVKNPYPILNEAEILVLSSKYEGLPNVLLEAQVLKKFIISTDCPTGPREILLNGKGGFLFKIGDFKGLANKILYYNKNKKKLSKLINFGRKKLDRFDYDLNLKKYLELVKNFHV